MDGLVSRKISSGVSMTLAMIGILSCSENSVTGTDSFDSNEVRAATTTGTPGAVSDLSVSATDSASVTLSFTQVSDGNGQPAKYDVRYAPSPIAWGSAPSVTSGSCTVPLAGTAISGVLSCTVLGLKASTKYDFQLVPYRGTLNQDAVFGPLSNVATGTTVVQSAPTPVASVTLSPSSASVQAGKTVQFSATTRDASGNILTGRTVTWTSGQSSVATVSSSGLVTGVAAGSAQITATSEGMTARASVTVSSASTNPGTVTNLGVSSIDTASVVLSFTQVDDGTGQPAQYDIRYAVAPISWGSATSVTAGTCKSPVTGTAIGTVLTCVAGGLRPSTKYNFQLVAFRGTLNFNAVFGALSNVAVATTTAPTAPPPPASVATITVSPATASLQTGGSIQLSATTRDSAGNVLSGRVITWASANSAVASVNSTGLVAAGQAGSTQITATSEGKSGSASINVSAPPPPPPPPPPSSLRANEPAGMTTITERAFNSKTEDPQWDNYNAGPLTIEQDPTAPYSPSSVIRSTLPAGFQAGYSHGSTGIQFSSFHTLYISYYAKYSTNWQGQQADINKQAYAWVNENGGSGKFVMEASGVGSGTMRPRPILQSMIVGDGLKPPNLIPSTEIVRGQWFHIEIVIRGNSPGAADGSFDLWQDGQHCTSYSGLQWTNGSTQWFVFELQPIWGGTSGTVTNTMWIQWDHVYVSGKN